jgi:hypothetical protein
VLWVVGLQLITGYGPSKAYKPLLVSAGFYAKPYPLLRQKRLIQQLSMASNDVTVFKARTAETFRPPMKGREFDKVSETAEQLAKQLKKNHIEDRSTLVNNSNILRQVCE